MAASDIVPLTVTYAPSGAGSSTVTVLGQVLNNGGTNWIPTGTSDNAIYLATTSEANAMTTVLGGTTYYYMTGPALPAQVTLSSVAQSGSASGASMTAGASSSGASMSSGPSMSTGGGGGMASSSSSASMAAASSSSSGAAMGGYVSCSSAGRIGLVMGLLCGLGVLA